MVQNPDMDNGQHSHTHLSVYDVHKDTRPAMQPNTNDTDKR